MARLIRNQFPTPLFRRRRSTQMAKHTNRLPMMRLKLVVIAFDDGGHSGAVANGEHGKNEKGE